MSTEIIAASAGTGKTFRLAEVLKRELLHESDPIPPERVVAVTFTRAAAAELAARVRRALLDAGEVLLAHRLAAARIGTIHAVCAHVVREHAFELGLSPELLTLDENLASQTLKNALEQRVSEDDRAVLDELDRRLGGLSWHNTAKRIIDAARENGDVDLTMCRERSVNELLAALPSPLSAEQAAALERELVDAVELVIAGSASQRPPDAAKIELMDLREVVRTWRRGERVPWPAWRKLADSHWSSLRRFAEAHAGHPALREDLERATRTVFDVAARAMQGYDEEKRTWGVFDFVDQEAFALALLKSPAVRPLLREQIGLVLVDEFQDTSPLQLAILSELSALAKKTVFVGDQKQAIYGFRGADPRLMEAVIDGIATTQEPLSVSYRSRPGLVALTSALFTPAFGAQGVPAERVQVTANLTLVDEPAGLGPFIERWRLSDQKQAAREIASGVRALIDDPDVMVRVRAPGQAETVRHARAQDIAVLARTNRHAREIAAALQDAGVSAVLRRRGLSSSLEVRAACAGLALFHDGRDQLAAAELTRLTRGAADADAWLQQLIADPAGAFVEDPYVAAVAQVAEKSRQAGVVLALDLVIEALRLRDACASWGDTAQRLANLGALRALAVRFVEERIATGAGATVVGFLARVDDLAAAGDREDNVDDEQGDVAGQDAVEVSTWHKAKGREWPIVVLAELVRTQAPNICGVHVESDAARVDVDNPLLGRWVRYWPHPYGDWLERPFDKGKGGVVDVLARHPWMAQMETAQKREELRLLYVGWTRARDRLVLPSVVGEMTGPRIDLWSGSSSMLRHLIVDGAQLLNEPADPGGSSAIAAPVGKASWAGLELDVVLRTPRARASEPPPLGGASVFTPLPAREYAAAFVAPSSVREDGDVLGAVTLGGPIILTDYADEDTMALLGTAIHGFFAVDPRVRAGALVAGAVDENDRFRLAQRLLQNFEVEHLLQPADVVAIADRLWADVAARFPSGRVRREAWVAQRLASGTAVRGQMDLVVEHDGGFAIVDHKTYVTEDPQGLARTFAGQLRAYAAALSAATSRPVTQLFVHLPLSGDLVEIR